MSARSIRRNRERAEDAARRRDGRRARRATLATGAAIGATALFAPAASAADFEVNTTADFGNGDCDAPLCLREAIDTAISNGEADTITFAPSLTGEIRLTGGQLDIYEDYGLEIIDEGPNEVTISGDANDDDMPDAGDTRIFSVYDDGPVEFTELTLVEGFADDQNGPFKYGGGAVIVGYGADLTITDSQLTDNYAEGPGGAVQSLAGEVTISGSEVSGNSGLLGGGIASSGFKFNPEQSDRRADAVESPSEAELTLVDSTISGNEAFGGGGVYSSGVKYAIFAESGPPDSSADVTLDVTDSTISGNEAEFGGGSLSKYSDTEVADSTISENIAEEGVGGIGGAAGILDIRDTVVSGNDAGDGDGGGIEAVKYSTFTLADSQVTGNSAGEDGGGVSFDENAEESEQPQPARSSQITETTISGNDADYYGAGLYVGAVSPDSSLLVRESTISGNIGGEDSVGGGIIFAGEIAGDVRLSNSTVSGNTATVGGGVAVDDNYVPPEGPPSEGSRADAADEVAEGGSLALSNSTIASNSATDAGGGIYLGRYAVYNPETEENTYTSTTVPLSSTIVADNSAAGGANDLAQMAEVDSPGGGFRLNRSLVETPGTATVTQDPAGASILGTDPALGGLADNGGPTRTHLPSQDSVVIDVGLANGLGQDQRGQVRTVDFSAAGGSGDGTDIGSVEVQNRPNTRRLERGEVPAGCAERNPFDSATLALAGDGASQIMQGTEGDDILRAFGGDDTVLGVGGNDCLTGDEGTDTVEGGVGDDFGDGGPGDDLVTGADGDDEIRGAAGTDLVKGEAGDDKVIGGGGEDRVIGSVGEDTLRGRFGDDRLSGGDDDDALRGGGGDDVVGAGSGDDVMRGGGGDDVIKVGGGSDDVNCGKGEDEVKGASANDTIGKNCEEVA